MEVDRFVTIESTIMQKPTKEVASEKPKRDPSILSNATPKIQELQPKLSIPPYSAKGVPQKPLREGDAALLGGER